MSLFRLREWWTVTAGAQEEFDSGNMCTLQLGAHALVFVGSFEGNLRVYCPRSEHFSPDHVALEMPCGRPILQVAIGQFIAGSTAPALAVLHPRTLVVYDPQVSTTDDGVIVTLQRAYEHRVPRNAYTLAYGPFGGVLNRDYCCVLTTDGLLCFFEQDRHAFDVALPGFLLPGPIFFNPKLDQLIVASSTLTVEAYKYSNLAASGGSSTGKKLNPDWVANIGEPVLDLAMGRVSRGLSSTQSDIIVLGEHHLVLLTESGTIRQMIRLNYQPVSLHLVPLPSPEGTRHNVVVASSTGSLLVYQSLKLAWTASVSFVPVAIRSITCGGTAGMLAVLSDAGEVVVGFLGTDPAVTGVVSETKDLDYASMDEEHAQLQQQIRALMSGEVQIEEYVIVQPTLGMLMEQTATEAGDLVDGFPLHVALSATSEAVNDVHVSIKVPLGVRITPGSCVVSVPASQSRAAASAVAVFHVWADARCLPSTTTVVLTAQFDSPSGQPRCVRQEVRLALSTVCRVVPPVKTASHKLTFDCSRDIPPLDTLFADMLAAMSGPTESVRAMAQNVMSFQFACGDQVTLLLAKSGNRVRVQSSTLECMWPLVDEMMVRIQRLGGNSSAEPVAFSLDEDLPLDEYNALIEQHFALRVRAKQLAAQLEQLSGQFRAVQKRLLVRFKEKTPTPLGSLPALVDMTYQQIIEKAKELEKDQTDLELVGSRLAAATAFVCMLISVKYDLDADMSQAVREHMCIDSYGATKEWEETVDAAVSHLIRTSLQRGSADSALPVSTLEMPPDAQRVCKRIKLMIDRLAKLRQSRK